jgi:hypothetical protein
VDKETGTKHIITTGWQAVLAQLFKLQTFNAFPIDLKVWAAKKPNQFGNYPLRLTTPE